MDWSWVDAVNLAIDLHSDEEYRNMDLDKLVNELWHEMEKENYAAMVARGECA